MASEIISAPSSRVEALRVKHAALSERIRQEQKRPSSADYYLKQLKKQKLQIKEEIEGIRKAATN